MKNFSLNLKNIFFKRLKYIILFSFLFTLYFFICAYSYASSTSVNISSSVFRFHVLANSNSEEDQNLKLLVRDNVLAYVNTLVDTSMTKDEVISTLEKNKDSIYLIANSTIEDAGYNYSVNISIGNFLFPTKSYGDISLPSGYYDGLRIEIGEAKGNNWWCVMFPPLCFVDVSTGIVPDNSKELLQTNLSSEEYQLLSEDSSDIKLKFKLLEFFNTSSFFAENH